MCENHGFCGYRLLTVRPYFSHKFDITPHFRVVAWFFKQNAVITSNDILLTDLSIKCHKHIDF